MRNAAPIFTVLLAATVAGCRSAPEGTDPASPPAATAASSPAPAAGTPARFDGSAEVPRPAADPASLYAACEDRVEQPEADGECTTDADCVSAGCSQELCVAAASAGDLMSTCEVQPCFSVLDSCGCVEGRCRWALDEAPSHERPPVVLPDREQGSQAPAGGEGAQ